MIVGDRLTPFLRDRPGAAAQFTPQDWSLLVREAQRNKLLCRIACLLREDGRDRLPPAKVRRKLDGALRTASGSARSLRWEVHKVQEALGAAGIPFVLLKGAAYEMAGLPTALGRLYVDVDIMVRRDVLPRAERALFDRGWISTKLDAYDQKYYRTWMHEIPPMQNLRRGTSLDVHHTILPPTAALKPDPELLWQATRELPGHPGVRVLSPADMILHSAVHLFHDGDLDGGLRDLVDLDSLLRHFSTGEGFWAALQERAAALDLQRPLFYALKYCRDLLATPVPPEVFDRSAVTAAPAAPMAGLMDRLVVAAMDPTRANLESTRAKLCRWLLYVRSHYLRMPLYLLIPHLARKALKQDGQGG